MFLNNFDFFIRENIFVCLLSVHNTISLSRDEQVCLIRLGFERYFSHHRAKEGSFLSEGNFDCAL